MADLSERFVRETTEQLRTLSNALLDLEGDAAAEVDRERVDELFRLAHSLKGRFATEGLDGASELAHALEDVLDVVRKGQLAPTERVIDDALAAVDACQAILDERHESGRSSIDVAPTSARLAAHAEAASDAERTGSSSASGAGADGAEPASDAPDDDLSPDVRRALDDSAEFDDLDDLLADVDGDEGTSPVTDADVDGWGTFDPASGEADAPAADDAVGPAPDETGGAAASGPDASADDGSVDEASADEGSFDEFITFEEMKDEADAGSEDLEELQADIEAEAFGEFDDEDDLSIEELLEVRPANEVTASPADPDGAESSTTDDLRSFDELSESVDPTDEDLEELQADIEAEAFGEFDDEDDLSIEELLDADPAELDPEAALDESAESAATDDGPPADASDGETTLGDGASTGDATSADDGTDTAVPDASTAESDDAGPDDAEVVADSSDPGAEAAAGADEQRSDSERPDAPSGDESAADAADDDWPAAFESKTAESATEDGPAASETGRDAEAGSGDPTTAAAADEPAAFDTVGDEPASQDGPVPDDVDLGDGDPFDVGAGDDGVADASGQSEADDLLDELPELGEPPAAEAEPSADADDVSGDDDFAFGFGQGEDYLDRVEFDSLFATYFSEDGALFGGGSVGGAEAVGTLEETRLDAAAFETAAGPEWRDATGPGSGADSVGSLSVDVQNADALLRIAEALGNVQRRLDEAVAADDLDAVEDVASDMRPYTSDLHHAVMSMRLMPLETVTSRLPRVVRDVASDLDKEVDFSVAGEDVRLDRNIIERLEDPLVHLVRNAVDHGIEPPGERSEKGKPDAGTLELSATRTRDRVEIELTDDGRGIDAEAVREAAVESGVVTEAEAADMTSAEVLDLVFRPQFSTRREVTDVSGRGVGMDVVRETVWDLTGSVEIESEPDVGTTVRLTLPVTVAVSQVLFVRAGGERFALPTSVIDAVELAERSADRGGATASSGVTPSLAAPFDDAATAVGGGFRSNDGGTAVGEAVGGDAQVEDRVGDEPAAEDTTGGAAADTYEPVDLAAAVSADGADAGGTTTGTTEKIVRIREEIRPLALRCEEVGDLEEVVIRPFEDLLGGTPGISGTTTGGGEGIVPVLDVRSIEP